MFVSLKTASYLLLALMFGTQGHAQQSGRKSQKLTSAETQVVGACLDIVRGCQLSDGAFNMVNHGSDPATQVWIAPYFVNHSMLALLAAGDSGRNPSDIVRVQRWLEWCVDHQENGGFWCDYVGNMRTYKNTGNVDAHDSSAALFLMVVDRYRLAGGKVSDKVRAAAKLSLRCIQNVTDKDGLTWAKPNYKVKYLMDNIEVYGGLAAAKKLFTAAGDATDAKAAGDQMADVRKGLKRYWEAAEKGRFAWALHPNGAFDGGLGQPYPHGLAQLFGIAFVSAEQSAFSEVVKTFKPQTSPEAAAGAERYLIAASRLGGPNMLEWRKNVVKDALGFTATNVYMIRPGLVALALLEDADWMPSVARGD